MRAAIGRRHDQQLDEQEFSAIVAQGDPACDLALWVS
jgi:hypothetical protein